MPHRARGTPRPRQKPRGPPDGLLTLDLPCAAPRVCIAQHQHAAATLDRVIASYTAQRDDLWLYDEQCRRWQAGTCTAAQQAEIARLTALLAQLRADIETLLDVTAQCQAQTIESILGMSDAALGLAVLTGQLQPPRAAPAPQPHSKTPRGKKR